MPQRLLELLRHLLKVGEVTGTLHDMGGNTIYRLLKPFLKSKIQKTDIDGL